MQKNVDQKGWEKNKSTCSGRCSDKKHLFAVSELRKNDVEVYFIWYVEFMFEVYLASRVLATDGFHLFEFLWLVVART